jgi:UDP:flavonoid glycosyltransferase YjiC (YdhE family)
MKTLVFAPETLNIAETTRMIEVARACRGKFNAVFLGYGGGYEYLIQEAGFPFHLLEPRLTPKRVEELWKADRMEWGGRFFTTDELITRVRNELALYEQIKPEAVVIGFTMSTLISTRAAGIPLVYVMPFAFTKPFFAADPDWGDVLDYPLLRSLPSQWLNKAINGWAVKTKAWVPSMQKAAKHFGAAPFERLLDLMEGDLNLVTDIPELTGVPTLPENWEYVGPIFAKLDTEMPKEILRLRESTDKLIYFAMGSSANRNVLVKAIRSFEGTPYTVIAPIKKHIEQMNISLPSNVHLFDWLPAHRVNPLADVAVIHGGQGTVQTAYWSGKPFAGIGLQPEQDMNILEVVKFGSAIHFKKYGLKKEKLLSAVGTLFTDPAYRERAAVLQQLAQQWDGAAKTAEILWNRFG